MARLYTNENFPKPAVDALKALGHDVLTTHEAGNSNASISDDEVVRFATTNNRVVVTLNRKDFILIHQANPSHAGIIVCSVDLDYAGLAARIDSELVTRASMAGALVRVNKQMVKTQPGRPAQAVESGSS